MLFWWQSIIKLMTAKEPWRGQNEGANECDHSPGVNDASVFLSVRRCSFQFERAFTVCVDTEKDSNKKVLNWRQVPIVCVFEKVKQLQEKRGLERHKDEYSCIAVIQCSTWISSISRKKSIAMRWGALIAYSISIHSPIGDYRIGLQVSTVLCQWTMCTLLLGKEDKVF